jgi:hypothetical protein
MIENFQGSVEFVFQQSLSILIKGGGFYSERAGEFIISSNRRTKLFS